VVLIARPAALDREFAALVRDAQRVAARLAAAPA
jgi:hypothetical protein